MIKYSTLFAVLILVIGCKQNTGSNVEASPIGKNTITRMYSKNVADSFTVSVNLPNGYDPQQKKNYPVVYLLDANIYFDIVATTLNKYSDIGLAPEVILVGIGYKNFPELDSLRSRDDTYPLAIPEYEMSVSGGADKFLSFISRELIPKIDKEYLCDTSNRVLMGHSLGGYFTSYALLQHLLGNNYSFNSYIAASPSLHFNHYYLLNQLKEIPAQKNSGKKIKSYISFGGMEDADSKDDKTMMPLSQVSAQLTELLQKKQAGCLDFKSDIYSNLGHMDTQLPTFIKGLQWMSMEDK